MRLAQLQVRGAAHTHTPHAHSERPRALNPRLIMQVSPSSSPPQQDNRHGDLMREKNKKHLPFSAGTTSPTAAGGTAPLQHLPLVGAPELREGEGRGGGCSGTPRRSSPSLIPQSGIKTRRPKCQRPVPLSWRGCRGAFPVTACERSAPPLRHARPSQTLSRTLGAVTQVG